MSGAPFLVRIWTEPFRSPSSTSAGAVPVFLRVSDLVVVVPSTCVVVSDVGVTSIRPEFSVKSERVALSAATLTALVCDWYSDLLAVNGCEPVSDENSW